MNRYLSSFLGSHSLELPVMYALHASSTISQYVLVSTSSFVDEGTSFWSLVSLSLHELPPSSEIS